jgi:archaellum biogenesis ATPase FlaH
MKKYLNDNFTNKTLFFLDAHVDNTNIHNYKKKCPLLEELEAIKSIERKDNVIMVDDLQILRTIFPWGETSYGNIDFLQRIKETILTINKDYKFYTVDSYMKDDVLVAYV